MLAPADGLKLARYSRQDVSLAGNESNATIAPSDENPPPATFCPASQLTVNSPSPSAPRFAGAVLTVMRPAAVLAGPGAAAAA